MLPDEWWSGFISILGVGTGGYGVFRLLEALLNYAKHRDSQAVVTRQELEESLRKDRATLRQEYAELRLDFEKLQEAYLRQNRQLVLLEAENIGLRGRYHRFVTYAQELVGHLDLFAERLGIPANERPTIPQWIHEEIDGPTSTEQLGRRAPKKPNGEKPHEAPNRRGQGTPGTEG